MIEMTIDNQVVNIVAFHARIPGFQLIPKDQVSENDEIIGEVDEEGNDINDD